MRRDARVILVVVGIGLVSLTACRTASKQATGQTVGAATAVSNAAVSGHSMDDVQAGTVAPATSPTGAPSAAPGAVASSTPAAAPVAAPLATPTSGAPATPAVALSAEAAQAPAASTPSSPAAVEPAVPANSSPSPVQPAAAVSQTMAVASNVAPSPATPPAATTVSTRATTAVDAAPTTPSVATTSQGPQDYIIQPEDVVQITVYQEADLTTRTRVSSEQEIILPLLGRVSVAGLSVAQLQERLTQLLGEDYLVNPQVQVFVEEYHPSKVFITGAVKTPGSYPLPTDKPTTVVEALTLAGGFTNAASANATRVIRSENGQERTILVKVADIMKKGDKSQDVVIKPNDIIFVPESFF